MGEVYYYLFILTGVKKLKVDVVSNFQRFHWYLNSLKMICNDFLAVKVNCLSSVFNIMKSVLLLGNVKNTTILEKSVLKCSPDDLFTF